MDLDRLVNHASLGDRPAPGDVRTPLREPISLFCLAISSRCCCGLPEACDRAVTMYSLSLLGDPVELSESEGPVLLRFGGINSWGSDGPSLP